MQLTALFNQSVKQGKVPREWTQAFITPVYKKGNVHEARNYRPVSFTCVTCKFLGHIMNHMEKHNPMTTLQHGFRKRHSCETQLLLTLDDLIMSYNRKTKVDAGVLDFSLAFDTVPHERLLGKLAHYGVKGPIHNWIRAFLTERTMWVNIDGASSPATRVLSGVTQGTVLGPLPFLIYKILHQRSPRQRITRYHNAPMRGRLPCIPGSKGDRRPGSTTEGPPVTPAVGHEMGHEV